MRRDDHAALGSLLGADSAMETIREQLALIARGSTTVVINGESGTGKELAARAIHELSARADGPFVAVDCTVLSQGISESQLFGHVRGAFTSADRDSVGFCRTAHGGTLFLDEIGDLPLHTQAKLLRTLELRQVVPVGGCNPIEIDVRVVAATHRDLGEMVEAGSFRRDLYYRLSVVSVSMPPLRDRIGDLEVLFSSFLSRFALPGHAPKRLTPGAWEALRRWPWPGNVRELRNVAEAISLLNAGDVVDVDGLPASMVDSRGRGEETASVWDIAAPAAVSPTTLNLDETIRAATTLALKLAKGNQNHAAEILGIDRKTLARKIQRYALDPADY